MKERIPGLLAKAPAFRRFLTKAFEAVVLAGLMSFLPPAFSPVPAQSGRKAPPAAKPSPAPGSTDGEASSEDEPTATNGKVAGDGETIEGDTLTVNTALVTVPVTVMDRTGRYVPNLKRRDFRVFENGVEQRIAYFAAVDQPFTVVLLIDTSGSTHFKMEEIQNAAINFVHQLKDQDRVMVMSFDDQIRTLFYPTNDRDAPIPTLFRTTTDTH